MAWPRIKNSRSSAQPGTQPHTGVQATVTPAADADPPPRSSQNTGVVGTTYAVAENPGQDARSPRHDRSASRRLGPIRYAHSGVDERRQPSPGAGRNGRGGRARSERGPRRRRHLDLRRHGHHRGARRLGADPGLPDAAPLPRRRPPAAGGEPAAPGRPIRSRSAGRGTGRRRRPSGQSIRPRRASRVRSGEGVEAGGLPRRPATASPGSAFAIFPRMCRSGSGGRARSS